ncbi:hypothetical protein JTB14_020031 [Gonioctena quinquepunctata]|nr:hypothetical protein JTB14_020031 [Gonioctena quinquepunctata]
MEKKKRVRAANFNAEEVRLLIRLALKDKHILENKQTDSEVWKLKKKELLEVLSLSVHGLPLTVDSDSVLPRTTVTGEKDTEVVKNVPVLIITEKEIESYDMQPLVIEPASESVVENIEDKKPKKNANGHGKIGHLRP